MVLDGWDAHYRCSHDQLVRVVLCAEVQEEEAEEEGYQGRTAAT